MAVTPLPTPPSSSDPANFSARGDAFLGALPTFANEVNAVAEAFNLNSTNSVSSTSDTIATGSTTITVETGKSYVVGMAVTIARTADGTRWMRGEVTAYDSGTGSLTVNVRFISSSGGTYSDWTISQAFIESSFNESVLIVSGNGSSDGYGSTNNKIPKFSTTDTDTGSAFTFSSTAANGASVTINEDGLYSILYIDSGTNLQAGISLNSSQLTTSVVSINATDRLSLGLFSSLVSGIPGTVRLSSGDIIRPHTNGNARSSNTSYLTVRRVG